MEDYESIIKYLKEFKENVNSRLYTSAKDLENDFYKGNRLTGIKSNIDIYENLNDIFKVHEFLISEVCIIHKSENDKWNEKIFKENINIKK